MANRSKYKEDFPLFDELAPMLPPECREEVCKTMKLLENVWRDDLCKATIVMITKGRRKAYRKSRVMRTVFGKVIAIIEGESMGSAPNYSSKPKKSKYGKFISSSNYSPS